MTITTVDLPRRFWTDRVERDLPMPTVVKYLSSKVRVRLDDEVLEDVLSDAVYYSRIVWLSGDFDLLGLQASARATVKAIRLAQYLAKQENPQ
jgi:hypothetical protein